MEERAEAEKGVKIQEEDSVTVQEKKSYNCSSDYRTKHSEGLEYSKSTTQNPNAFEDFQFALLSFCYVTIQN